MAKKHSSLNPAASRDLRAQAEERPAQKHLSTGASTRSNLSSPEEMLRLIHELEVQKSELDNSLRVYTELYDSAPVGYLTLTRESNIQQANLTAAKMLGVEQSRLQNMHLKQFVVPEDYRVIDNLLEAVFTSRVSGNCEVKLMAETPSPLPVLPILCGGSVRIDARISATGYTCQIILLDITEKKRKEEKLLESQAIFSQALEAAHAGVWQWDLKTNELFWSDEIWHLSGLKRGGEKPSFKLWEESIHPDDREVVVQSITADVKNSAELNFEYRLAYPCGSVRWLMSRGKPLKNGQGEVDRYIGTVIDITERKQSEETLKKHKERFKALFDNHTSIMLVIDPVTLSIVDANHAAAEFYGWSTEKLQKIHAEQISIVSIDNLQDDIKKIRRLELNRIIRKCKRADGSVRDVEITSNSIVIEGKELIYLVINDISDRKIAEKLIFESNERFRLLFDNMLNGIAYCRMIFEESRPVDFIYELVNPSFEKLTGLREVEGKRVSEVISGIHQLHPELLEIYGRVASTGKPDRFEIQFMPLAIWLDISVYSVQKEHFVAVFENITEHKREEQLVVEGKAKLEAALSSMSDAVFISDTNGNFTHFNDAFATFHKFKNKEECARAFDEYPMFLEVFSLKGEPLPAENWAVQRALRGETSTGVEFSLHRKDSGETWFGSYNYAPLRDQDGLIVGSVVTARDISSRKEAEQRIISYVQQLENSMRGTLQAVANVVEAHDPYTAGHERRVGIISVALAREMGWSEEKSNTMLLIGLVHDIGKMSIPSEILSKPSILSPIEFELVKTHAEQGYEILRDIEFPLPIAEIIREHHERMDGSGYPRGLKGEEILFEARILAVADVLEAMASHRPYRASLGIEATINEIEAHRGDQFDQEVVDAMLRLFREKGYQLPE